MVPEKVELKAEALHIHLFCNVVDLLKIMLRLRSGDFGLLVVLVVYLHPQNLLSVHVVYYEGLPEAPSKDNEKD